MTENIFDDNKSMGVSQKLVELFKATLGDGHDEYAINPATVVYTPSADGNSKAPPPENTAYTLSYSTFNGQDFTASVNASGVTESITSANLNLKATGGPQLRANTVEDAGSRRVNEGQHNAHLIADEFRGSGFKPSQNVATTSGTYNADVRPNSTMRWAELGLGHWIEKTADAEDVPAEFSLTVDVGWWPLDQVDSKFIAAVKRDAEFIATKEDTDAVIPTKAEINTKIEEYKDRHKTTKLKRISSMKYTAKVKLDDGSFTPEKVFNIGPDIWLAITGG
jgi:hypothetical protein